MNTLLTAGMPRHFGRHNTTPRIKIDWSSVSLTTSVIMSVWGACVYLMRIKNAGRVTIQNMWGGNIVSARILSAKERAHAYGQRATSSAVCFITDYKVEGFRSVRFLLFVPNQTSRNKQPSSSILLQRPSYLNNLSIPTPQDEVHSRPCYLCRRRLRSNHRWHSRMCSYLHWERRSSRWLLVWNWRRMRLRTFHCCSEWLY